MINIITQIQDGDRTARWWRSVSLVCAYWHIVARDAAILWTTPWASYGPKLFRTAMDGSGDFPLDAMISGPLRWCLECLVIVQPHADRIRSLSFGPEHEDLTLALVLEPACMDFETRNLTTLHINFKSIEFRTPLTITKERYPRLRDLTFECGMASCDDETYASLTCLALLEETTANMAPSD